MRPSHKGFTLIELLVVVAIIGLLSSVVLASLNATRARARDAQRISDLKQLQVALELYASDHGGAYPLTSASAPPALWGNCSSFGSRPNTGATGWIPGLAPAYMPVLPTDPSQTEPYRCYTYRSNGTDYMAYAFFAEANGGAGNPLKRPGESAIGYPSMVVYTPGAAAW